MHALTISLVAEIRASPIRVDAIVPGWINTSILVNMLALVIEAGTLLAE